MEFWPDFFDKKAQGSSKEPSRGNGKLRTISESSIKRNLKLNDEAGISSLPDAELFENLTLMGYNISPNQKFTFQQGQFSHQWKYLIHTIMQCLSPKSTGFNEFSSNIATALVCLAANRVYNFSKMIFDGMVQNVNNKVSKFLMYPRKYIKRARIAQSSALPTAADEHASPIRDGSQGEACPTELTALCTSLQRQQTEPMSKFEAQKLEITSLKARIKMLEDKDGWVAKQSGDDAPIKGRSLESGEETVPTGSGSVPTASPIVPTGSDVVPTASPIFTIATVDTPYTRRKGKEKMMIREDQRRNEQIERDAKMARLHPEEELQMMIDGLDIINETVAKYLQEYYQFATELPIEERIELIKESKRFKRKGVRLEQDSAKKVKTSEEVPEEKLKEMMGLISVEEVYVEALQVKHPIIDWEVHTKGERSYWKIIRLEGSTTSYQFFVDLLKHFDREDLNQLWGLVKETLNIRPAANDKEKELWVEMKRLYEPDVEDQLWTHTQNMMHARVEWKLYDTYGVHHVISKDQEMFMLVEKDYPLRKGLAIVMICYKLQVENYSQMANDLILKIYKIANSQR
nr:synaptobrevin, longin-like domain protein [Tanacetum cinerariifolium]